jgi:cytochrome c oxidase accessory protein FixG
VTAIAPRAIGRVLPTLNEDGTRRWVRPRPSLGRFWRARRTLAYVLMAVYLAIPHLRMNDRPLILLDAPRREFTLFGYTFLPTDTLLLMLFLGTVIIGVFLLTALFGRVWCGWACPQTVWMEYLFRPLERLIEGGAHGSLAIDRSGRRFHPRRMAKNAVIVVLALVLAHTFLAYFVGVDQLRVWVTRSPVEHPASFGVMAVTSLLVVADFAYFREQVCTIACPYGRWQSALLDRSSLIVAYDERRGEPRARGTKRRDAGAGDCIDCGLCVQTCPTGIDIREGLQMECIHCAQCIDACDAVMDKIGKPRGLIRYSSRAALAGEPRRLIRPRTVLYPVALAGFLGTFIVQLSIKDSADVVILPGAGAPFNREPDGRIANQIRVKISNRGRADAAYRIDVTGVEGGTVIAPVNPLKVSGGRTELTSLFVLLPADAFDDGERAIRILVSDGREYRREFDWRVLGPREERERRDSHERDTTERDR